MKSRALYTLFALILSFGMFASNSALAQLEWSQLHVPPTRLHTMSYDSARGVTVLFGGTDIGSADISNTRPKDQTWEWNGTTWTQRLVTGPSPRIAHAMVYDSARGVTVLFGGNTSGISSPTASNETWEWDGTSWTQRLVTGPSARYAHAMVYDAARGVTVLFGGYNGSSHNDETWEWNGTAWTQRVVSGPSPRFFHSMSYDSTRSRTVLFGGQVGPVPFFTLSAETWEWDGTAWTQRPVAGPSARSYSAMAFDSARSVTVLFGGGINSAPGPVKNGETWEWNGSTWTPRVASGPVPRIAHAMAFDSARGVTVLFGGNDGPGDTWEWSGTAWSQETATTPLPVRRHAMVFDKSRSVAVMFTGEQTWEWNGSAWTHHLVTGPSRRFDISMSYDSDRNVTVLFGGYLGSPGSASDTWEWNGTTWTQRPVTGPTARRNHAMAFDSARGVTVLFGGSQSNNVFSGETWEWNGTTWTLRAFTGPSARMAHAMAYDVARGVTVLFGGRTPGYDAETWEWDGATWTQRVVPGPSPRGWHAMAYDTDRGITVLFGGELSTGWSDETWEWNGTNWIQRPITGPEQRLGHAMTYDEVRGTMLLSGGGDNRTTYGELWGLRAECQSPSFDSQPANAVACPGGTATFIVAADGEGVLSYQWRHNNVDLADEPGHIAGVNSSTLSLTNVSDLDEGIYAVIVSNTCGILASNDVVLTMSPADFNNDNLINSQDFFAFIGAFFGNLPTGDYNHDGAVNSQDLFDFLTTFFDPC